jgi:hypothetical protein
MSVGRLRLAVFLRRVLLLLSRCCDGCAKIPECKIRFSKVARGEFVYCSDGTPHLVDSGSEELYS